MTTLVILRFLGIFAVYTGVTLALPALMFRRILRGRSLAEQFLMCYTFGNFYIINIVFLLQLLHISNFFTLAGLTAVLSIVIGGRVNRIPLKQQAGNTWHLFGKLLRGRMKLKSAIFLFLGKCAEGIKRLVKFFYRHIVKNPIQSMLLLGIGVCLCWIYGRQIILVYGYRASDIPVHMSWINEMSRGKIFAKGVYPFGFHCMIYYLHAVFRFDTYVILCQFFFAQVIFMHLVLLAMLKQLCKTKYIPYIGTFVFLLGNFWSGQTYSRFYATLPQEFGMIFVIPSIYFLIRFFQIPKQKLADKETRLTLQCFAMAFSLTLAIHFYGTMIAGLCCIGIACGFCFRFLRKEYFCQQVGEENIYIFGQSSDQVIHRYAANDYVAAQWYENDANIRRAIDFLNGPEMLAAGHSESLNRLHHELIHKDWFQTLPDFNAYVVRKGQALSDYTCDPMGWRRKCLVNIAKAGLFSSDRTIAEYDHDIWHLGNSSRTHVRLGA